MRIALAIRAAFLSRLIRDAIVFDIFTGFQDGYHPLRPPATPAGPFITMRIPVLGLRFRDEFRTSLSTPNDWYFRNI